MKTSKHGAALSRWGALWCVVMLAVCLLPLGAQADSYWFNIYGGTTPWSTTANWSTNADGSGPAPLVAPGAGDTATFNTSVSNGAVLASMAGDYSINGLVINNTGNTTLYGNSTTLRTFTIGAGGITMNANAGQMTFGNTANRPTSVALGASQAWNNNSSSLLLLNLSTNTTLALGGYTLTIGGSGATTINDPISGSAAIAIIKNDAGTLTLSGTNTYSGATTINNGTLTISGAGQLGSGNYAAAITNNGTLRLASTASQTLSGNITGSGSVLSDSGAGDLTLSGTGNDFTGDVGFSASGTRSVTVASLGNGSGNIRMFQNNQFHTTASITTTKGLVLGGVANVSQNIYADAGTLTINGVISDNAAISGAAKVYFRSAGSFVLGNAANTYGEQTYILTTVSVGSIKSNGLASSLGQPGTAAQGVIAFGLTATAGQLTYTGTGDTTDRQINLNGTTGGATLDQSGTGLLKFTSGLTASGAGAKTLTLQGSTAGSGELAGAIVDSTSATAVTKGGTGSWLLSGTNTYTGATAVNAGVLRVANNSGLGTSAGGVTVASSAELELDGSAGALTIGAEALSISGGGTNTTGALRNIAGNNTYGGAISLAAVARINSDSGTLTLSSGSPITSAQNLVFGGAGNIILNDAFNPSTAAKNITKDGSGTLTLGAANGNTGTITIGQNGYGSGTIKYGINNAINSACAVTLNPDGSTATLDLNGYNGTIASLTLGGANGTASSVCIVQTGAGTLTLGGNVTTVATGNPTTTPVISGKLDLGGADRTFSPANSTGSASDLNVTANVSGTGGLLMGGAGTMYISGNNSFTGDLGFSGSGKGDVYFTSANSMGSGNTGNIKLYQNDALHVTNVTTITTEKGVVFAGGNAAQQDIYVDTGTLTIGGLVTCSTPSTYNASYFNFRKYGTGTLVLTNDANTFNTRMQIYAGILSVSSIKNIGEVSALGQASDSTMGAIAIGNATLQYTGTGDTSDRAISLVVNNSVGTIDQSGSGLLKFTSDLQTNANAHALVLQGAGAGEFAGAILDGGGISLTKAGTGTWTLSGVNTYTGPTIISAGKLQLGNSVTDGSIGTSSSITNNATLEYNLVGSQSYGNVIAGSGKLIKSSTGALTLSGVNTFSGGTTVNGGTLALSGSGAVGSGAIDIKSGALFNVSGTTSGTYTLGSGQSLTNRGLVAGGLIVGSGAFATGGGLYQNVTNAAGGLLTPGLGGDTNGFADLTLAGGSSNLFWVGSAATHDLSIVTNSLSYSGDGVAMPQLRLNLTSYAWNAGDQIVLYQNTFAGASAFDGTSRYFQFQDAFGSVSNLYNNALFSAVTDGGSATNVFFMRYNFNSGDGSANDILLTAIPEPTSLNMLVILGAAYWLRRRLHGSKRRWDV